MHEQTAETQISLDIDTVWSESLMSAPADLSLLGLQAAFYWFEFSRTGFIEMILGMIIKVLMETMSCDFSSCRLSRVHFCR